MRKLLIAGVMLITCILVLSASCTRTDELSSSTLTSQSTSQTTEQTTSSQPVQPINTHDAYNLILNNQENPDFVIIDVRGEDLYNTAHIANAINVPYSSPNFKALVGIFDKNKHYLVYCKMGKLSTSATQAMADMGFKYLYALSGGIDQWIQDGYTVISGNTTTTTDNTGSTSNSTTTTTDTGSTTTSTGHFDTSQIEIIQDQIQYNQTD